MSVSQILIGEVTSFFVKTEGAQEKTIVTVDCCYFNPLLRRIVRFLGQSSCVLHQQEEASTLLAPNLVLKLYCGGQSDLSHIGRTIVVLIVLVGSLALLNGTHPS